MSKIAYINKRFKVETRRIIEKANEIILEYASEGMGLTLRQLYYQFVSRDIIANKQSEYKRLGKIISDARMAGYIDWYAIEDRTRNLKGNYHNTDPGQAIDDALDCFMLDKWENQLYRPEVWIEKEALIGVISGICSKLDVPYFACKGYTSQSEMWRAARRMQIYENRGQTPVIIHLGDHDPSGIDMTRDIIERHQTFMGGIKVERIALNYDQIKKFDPPPNPTKLTDTRAGGYIDEFGRSSWELDALEPRIIRELIESKVKKYMNPVLLSETMEKEEKYREILEKVRDNWETI